MAQLIIEGADVEFIDVGSVEVKFISQKALEWAKQHHVREMYVHEEEGKYCIHTNKVDANNCIISRYDAACLAARMACSGLSVVKDPKLSGSEKLRWINTY
jgi:hypothetical protein